MIIPASTDKLQIHLSLVNERKHFHGGVANPCVVGHVHSKVYSILIHLDNRLIAIAYTLNTQWNRAEEEND